MPKDAELRTEVEKSDDLSKIVNLGVLIGSRRMVLMLLKEDTEPQHVIAAVRLLAFLSGKGEEAPQESKSERMTHELSEALARSEKAKI